MNNQNKHKPLNPDELFKLLEEKSNSSDSSFSHPDLNDLDDFEKEALEGFAMHTTPAKAKALMEEIDLEISKKTQVEEKKSDKNKIIWFSAAASLVLVIGLSVFLMNQTQKEQESNIALNEIKSADEMTPAKELDNNPPAPPVVTETTEAAEGKEKLKQATVEMTTNAKRTEPDTKLAEEKALEFSNTITQSGKGIANDNKPVVSGTTQNQLDYKKNDNANYDGDALSLSDKTTAADDKEDVKKKEVDQIVSTSTNGVASNYNEVVTTKSLSKSTKDEAPKERAVFKKNKAAQKSTNAKFETAAAEMEYSAATVPASANVANTQGYFIGGEVSIKDQVLTYFKNKSITQTLKGTFKVTASIDEKGKLSVDTLSSVNDVCTDCIKPLKEALNSMNNWQPALKQGKPVSSKTGFTLIF